MLYLSTKLTVREARRQGIKATYLDRDSNLVKLTRGKTVRVFKASRPPQNSAVSMLICVNKDLTLKILKAAKIPIPRSQVFHDEAKALSSINNFPLPAVVKCGRGTGGENVFANLRTKTDIKKALCEAFSRDENVIVEQLVKGHDYRVLVAKGKAVACLKRIPARITGDGRNSIKELIAQANRDPRRGPMYTKPLVTIEIDENTKRTLRNQGMTLKAIPKLKQEVFVKNTANLCTGGEVEDYTKSIHSDYKRISVKAAKALGNIPFVGLDFITPDITKPWKRSRGVIIEANDAPMIQLHQLPTLGKPVDVAKIFINLVMKKA